MANPSSRGKKLHPQSRGSNIESTIRASDALSRPRRASRSPPIQMTKYTTKCSPGAAARSIPLAPPSQRSKPPSICSKATNIVAYRAPKTVGRKQRLRPSSSSSELKSKASRSVRRRTWCSIDWSRSRGIDTRRVRAWRLPAPVQIPALRRSARLGMPEPLVDGRDERVLRRVVRREEAIEIG